MPENERKVPFPDRSLTDEEAEAMLVQLRKHYGQNVAPVSKYCDAFFDWEKALAAKVDELRAELDEQQEVTAEVEALPYADKPGWYWKVAQLRRDAENWERVLAALACLYLPIMKSNYLARRIYGGEPHRTEKCPVHKGQWVGCYPPDEPDGACACARSGDTCGWLPA